MATEFAGNYLQDPQYQRSLHFFQAGQWEDGLNDLNELIGSYPYEQNLRELRQQMEIRSRIDDYERQDIANDRRRRITKWGIRIAALVVVVGVIVWGAISYYSWFQMQLTNASQRIQHEAQSLEIAFQFRDAQSLLQAGQPDQAKAMLLVVEEYDPEYPGLAEVLAQAETMIALDEDYSQAVRLIDLGDLSGALTILEDIETREPYYRDVSLRITQIKGQFFMAEMLAQADKSYDAQDWVQAASGYETVRAINPSYKPDTIEERLFQSYMNAAINALAEETDSLEALGIAEDYFQKALALRPQDPVLRLEREQARQAFKDRLAWSYMEAAKEALLENEDSLQALSAAEEYFRKAAELRPNDAAIRREQQLARLYLTALDDYRNERWSQAIQNLEALNTEDPDYALGTASLTLYTVYLARADENFAASSYEAALADYQTAIRIAEETEEPGLRLYEAQVKLAKAYGTMGQYEQAVIVYRAALEQGGLLEYIQQEAKEYLNKLDQADLYFRWTNFRSAYKLYSEITSSVGLKYTLVTHKIESGEYLTQLANRYGTTVDAIIAANEDINSKQIEAGQEIVIPTIP